MYIGWRKGLCVFNNVPLCMDPVPAVLCKPWFSCGMCCSVHRCECGCTVPGQVCTPCVLGFIMGGEKGDTGGRVGDREDVARGQSRQRCPCTAGVWLFRMALLRGQWDEGTYQLSHSGTGRRGQGQQQGPDFWVPWGHAAVFSVLRLCGTVLFKGARAHPSGPPPARRQVWVQAGRRQRVSRSHAWGGCQRRTLPQKQAGLGWVRCIGQVSCPGSVMLHPAAQKKADCPVLGVSQEVGSSSSLPGSGRLYAEKASPAFLALQPHTLPLAGAVGAPRAGQEQSWQHCGNTREMDSRGSRGGG